MLARAVAFSGASSSKLGEEGVPVEAVLELASRERRRTHLGTNAQVLYLCWREGTLLRHVISYKEFQLQAR